MSQDLYDKSYADLTYIEMLDVLATGSGGDKRRLANVRLPEDIALALAQDEEEPVRRWLADNPYKLSASVLILLAKDEDVSVCMWLINRDQDLPLEALKILAKSSDYSIRHNANRKLANTRQCHDSNF